MNRRLRAAVPAALLMAMSATAAGAAVEREDIMALAADGRHYTSYKTLRSDLPERVLYLGPDETPADSLFIVPSDYETTRLDNGATQLRFASGSYAVMNTGRFDAKVRRASNGDLIFSSDDAAPRADGHVGKWNSPGDFDSFTYTWIVPANIDIRSYRANRDGQWQQRDNTLTWRGHDVNDIAFTIRYRIGGAPPATASETAPTPAPRPAPAGSPRIPAQALRTSPSRDLQLASAVRSSDAGANGDRATAAAPAPVSDTPTRATDTDTRSVQLPSVVFLANGRPMITAHGHVVLDRLADSLADSDAVQITVVGPAVADRRDMGGSAAQAARVADYLSTHGVPADKLSSQAGDTDGRVGNTSVAVSVQPGRVIEAFSPDS